MQLGIVTWHTQPEVMVEQYGRATIRLKASVRRRMTVTVGDSLDEPNVQGVPAGRASLRAMDTSGAPDLLAAAPPGPELGRELSARYSYLEAQIHGGITLGDIAEIVFEYPPSPDLAALLTQHGIAWRVVP